MIKKNPALKVYLSVRIMASMVAFLSNASFPLNTAVAPPKYLALTDSRILHALIAVWERADASWYIGISQSWYSYDQFAAAFMPLYPVLIRVLSTITPFSPLFCALIISNLAFYLSLRILYRIARQEIGDEAATRSLWYLALFPGSFFLLAPLSESLFLCLALASIDFARRSKWWRAVLLGSLLGVTRNIGALIALPLAFEAFKARGLSAKTVLLRLFQLSLCGSGILLWMAYWLNEKGDALYFLHQQSGWSRQSALPWDTFIGGMKQAYDFMMGFPGGIYLFEALSVGGCFLLGLVSLKKLAPSFSAYFWIFFLPPLLAPFPGNLLMSCLRFMTVIFPTFMTLGVLARKPAVDDAIRVSFAGAYGLALAMYVCNQLMF